MITLDLARAHIDELQRAAAREASGLQVPRRAGMLRRAVSRHRR